MFEKRLYRLILFMTLIISSVSILGNILIRLPMIINVKWIALFVISLIGYVKEKKNQKTATFKYLYFFFVITVIIPMGYIDAGNLSGSNSIAYMFLFLIGTIFLFKGIERYTLVALNIGSFFVLRTVAYHIPTMVRVYSDRMIFLDQLVQVSLALFVSYYIIKGFSDLYEEQKKNIAENQVALREMQKKLDASSGKDGLTSLYNRKGFSDVLDRIVQEEQMKHDDVYILIFSLANFRMINDTLGHTVGDEVLMDFSKILINKIDVPHVVGRWGGNEFAMVYKGKKELLEDLIFDLRECYHQTVKSLKVSSSIHFGCLKWHHEDNADEVMRKVNQCLYQSKQKNTVNV